MLLTFPNPSFGGEKYFDHVLVDIEEKRLTIKRESVANKGEDWRLKLNGEGLREKGIFSVHLPGKWCRRIHVPNIGDVRIVIEVPLTNLNDISRDYLPIAAIITVNDQPVVKRFFSIDPYHKKPLNKIVVNGDKIWIEIYKGDEKPEIRKHMYRFDSWDGRLLPRPPPIKGLSYCPKKNWMVHYSDDFNDTHDFRSVLGDIYFPSDEFKLNDQIKEKLKKLIKFLNLKTYTHIEIQGHADEKGDNLANLELGEKRANSIKSHLISFGVDEKRLHTTSYGEGKPICIESNEGCLESNNRVVFMLSQ